MPLRIRSSSSSSSLWPSIIWLLLSAIALPSIHAMPRTLPEPFNASSQSWLGYWDDHEVLYRQIIQEARTYFEDISTYRIRETMGLFSDPRALEDYSAVDPYQYIETAKQSIKIPFSTAWRTSTPFRDYIQKGFATSLATFAVDKTITTLLSSQITSTLNDLVKIPFVSEGAFSVAARAAWECLNSFTVFKEVYYRSSQSREEDGLDMGFVKITQEVETALQGLLDINFHAFEDFTTAEKIVQNFRENLERDRAIRDEREEQGTSSNYTNLPFLQTPERLIVTLDDYLENAKLAYILSPLMLPRDRLLFEKTNAFKSHMARTIFGCRQHFGKMTDSKDPYRCAAPEIQNQGLYEFRNTFRQLIMKNKLLHTPKTSDADAFSPYTTRYDIVEDMAFDRRETNADFIPDIESRILPLIPYAFPGGKMQLYELDDSFSNNSSVTGYLKIQSTFLGAVRVELIDLIARYVEVASVDSTDDDDRRPIQRMPQQNNNRNSRHGRSRRPLQPRSEELRLQISRKRFRLLRQSILRLFGQKSTAVNDIRHPGNKLGGVNLMTRLLKLPFTMIHRDLEIASLLYLVRNGLNNQHYYFDEDDFDSDRKISLLKALAKNGRVQLDEIVALKNITDEDDRFKSFEALLGDTSKFPSNELLFYATIDHFNARIVPELVEEDLSRQGSVMNAILSLKGTDHRTAPSRSVENFDMHRVGLEPQWTGFFEPVNKPLIPGNGNNKRKGKKVGKVKSSKSVESSTSTTTTTTEVEEGIDNEESTGASTSTAPPKLTTRPPPQTEEEQEDLEMEMLFGMEDSMTTPVSPLFTSKRRSGRKSFSQSTNLSTASGSKNEDEKDEDKLCETIDKLSHAVRLKYELETGNSMVLKKQDFEVLCVIFSKRQGKVKWNDFVNGMYFFLNGFIEARQYH